MQRLENSVYFSEKWKFQGWSSGLEEGSAILLYWTLSILCGTIVLMMTGDMWHMVQRKGLYCHGTANSMSFRLSLVFLVPQNLQQECKLFQVAAAHTGDLYHIWAAPSFVSISHFTGLQVNMDFASFMKALSSFPPLFVV